VKVQFLPNLISGVRTEESFLTTFGQYAVRVFGTQWKPDTLSRIFTLPTTLAEPPATVNGMPRPFYYDIPTQLNIQIPYGISTEPRLV